MHSSYKCIEVHKYKRALTSLPFSYLVFNTLRYQLIEKTQKCIIPCVVILCVCVCEWILISHKLRASQHHLQRVRGGENMLVPSKEIQ